MAQQNIGRFPLVCTKSSDSLSDLLRDQWDWILDGLLCNSKRQFFFGHHCPELFMAWNGARTGQIILLAAIYSFTDFTDAFRGRQKTSFIQFFDDQKNESFCTVSFHILLSFPWTVELRSYFVNFLESQIQKILHWQCYGSSMFYFRWH